MSCWFFFFCETAPSQNGEPPNGETAPSQHADTIREVVSNMTNKNLDKGKQYVAGGPTASVYVVGARSQSRISRMEDGVGVVVPRLAAGSKPSPPTKRAAARVASAAQRANAAPTLTDPPTRSAHNDTTAICGAQLWFLKWQSSN